MILLEAPKFEVEEITLNGKDVLKIFGITLRKAKQPLRFAGRLTIPPIKIKLENDDVKIGEKYHDPIILNYGNRSYEIHGYFVINNEGDAQPTLHCDYIKTLTERI